MPEQTHIQNLKWIIYCRKSSDSEDKQVESLPAQIKELKELARKNNLNIVKTYQESHSAFHPGRPDFNEMMGKFYNDEANAVLVWAGNRITRNPVDAGAFIYAMDQGKLKVIKTIGSTYFNTPDHKLVLSMDFTMSKKSSDDLSVAVHRGNKQKFFENKEWGGPAKQGFVNYIDPLTRKRDIKMDGDRFNLLQQAGKSIINGKFTPLEALDWLNKDMGYTTLPQRKQGGGPLSETTFYNFLSDSFYYGIMKHKVGGIFEEGKHKYKKMFTKDEWNIIQIRLGKKSRSKQKKHDFPFKGVMSCGECGGFVTAEEKWQIICPKCKTKFAKTKNTNKCKSCDLKIEKMDNPTILHYIYYHCTKKVNKNCAQGYLEIAELEKQVDQELKRFEIDPDFKDWAIKHISELNDQESDQDQKATKQNTGNYESLKSRLRRMTKHRFSDSFEQSSQEEKDIYEEELRSLKSKIEIVKENIEVADQKQYDWIDLSRKTFEFACYARYWFHNGDIKTKTQILQLLGQNLKLYNKKVLVDEDNIWWMIEKGKKEIQELEIKVEPTKKASRSGFNTIFDPAIPILLRN
ncbi:recombinase family protein [Patescibacteria group bacterium]|nr:recombinase family protein [Patescibacteria group bacterium]